MASTVLRSAARTLYRVLALSAFLTLALASAALADDVTNRIDTTVDATLENITLNEGATQSVNLRVVPVNGDGDNGCNIDAGEQLVSALSSSDTSVATLSPQALTFTACNVDQSTTVTAGARGTATVTAATQSNTTGTGTYNYAPASFSVTVNNVPPTITNIADQTTNEDTSTGNVAFTVGDAGTPAGNLTVSGTSSNTTLVPNSNITFGGSGANRTVNVTPAADQSGTATITVTVSDGAATASDTFVLNVNAVNDAPTITNIADQTTNEDTSTGNVAFTVGDIETAVGSLTVTGNSSNTTLVPNSNITFGGSGANRTVNVTPAADRSGTATITVTVNDGSTTGNDTFVLTVNAVNDAPVISSVTNGGPVGEGSPATVTVTATDVEGDTRSYEFDCNNDSAFEIGPQGTDNAQCTYNDDGTRRVNVRVSDGNGGTATGFTNVTVNNVAPNAVNDSATAQEAGSNVAIDVLANDTDVSADTLTITGHTQPAAGEGSVNCSTSNCTFTPSADFNGSTSFTYTISDGDGGTDTATVSITVNAVNDAPSFTKGADQTVQEDAGAQSVSSWASSISAGPADESGQSVSFIVTTNNDSLFTAGGRPAVSSDGTLTYTPAANASGTASVTVRAEDDGGTANGGDDTSAPQSFAITVNAVNDNPTADNQSVTTNEDVAKTITLVGSDIDGDALAFGIPEGPSSGNLGAIGPVNCTGTSPKNCEAEVTYTPQTDYNGSDSFKFRVDDGSANSADATVSITVDATNDPPKIDLNGGASGIDHSATFSEGGGPASIVASGALTVSDVDDAIMESATVKITNLKNGADESLAANTGGTTISANYNAGTGELNLSGAAPRADYQQVLRTVRYDNASQNPDTTDRNVTFVVNDGDANSDVATSTVAIGADNDAPANSVPGAQTTDEDAARVFSAANSNRISISDADAGSSPVEVTLDATNGKLTMSGTAGLTFTTGDGSNDTMMTFTGGLSDTNAALNGLRFEPDANYNGAATLTITTDDQGNTGSGGAKSDADAVNLTVNAVNDAPTADARSVTAVEDLAETITLTGSDVDGDDLTFHVTSGPTEGVLGTIGDATCTGTSPKTCQADVVYTPLLNFDGSDSFTFHVKDGTANSTGATVSVTVDAVADAPVISDIQAQTTDEDTATPDIPFTVNDADTLLNSLTLDGSSSNTTLVPNSNITIVGSGTNRTVKVTPAANQSGTATITVSVSDGVTTATDSFLLTVNAVNDAPTITLNGASDASEGQTKTYDYAAVDPDSNGFEAANGFPNCGDGGTFVAGSLTTTAAGGSFECRFPDGPASPTVQLRVTDTHGADSNTATRNVTVGNVAPAISLGGPANAEEGDNKTYTFAVTDPGDDTHALTTACGTNGDKVAGSDDYDSSTMEGSFRCSFPDGPATSSVTARVTDSDAASDSDNQVVSVAVANVAPVAQDDGPYHATEDEPLSVGSGSGVLSNDTDAGAYDALGVELAQGPDHGAVELEPDGSFTYTPDANFNGTDSFNYEVCDDAPVPQCDAGVVNILVNAVNDAPLATLSGPNAVNEGSSHTYNFAVSDPDPGDTFTVNGGFPDCGAGGVLVENSLDTTPPGYSFECRFPDGPASTDVKIQVADAQGVLSGIDAKSVSVANVAPSIQLTGPATAEEGDTKTYSYTVTDPGNDSHTPTTFCGANGVEEPDSDAYNPVTGEGSFRCRFPDGPANSQVTTSVVDSDGAQDADNRLVEVEVANVAPAVVLNGPATADEGDTRTYSYTVTDPGDPNPVITESCGANGTRVDTPAPNSFECNFSDGPANSNVSVVAVDPAGDTASDVISLQVANVAPGVVLTGPAATDEGLTETYSYTVSDPGLDPNPAIVEGCGANAAYVDTPALDSFRCTFAAGPATSSVGVDANDGDDTGSDSFAVNVGNLAPTISNITDQTTNQDTPTGAIPFTVGDAGTPANSLTLTASSDNQALVPNSGIAFGGSGKDRSLTITPASGQSGTATITVSVRDDGGQVVADTFVLTVNAVDRLLPTVSRPAPGGKKVSPTAMVTATFSEPMNEASVEAPGVFTLKMGAKKVPATVTYNPATQTATLDPTKNLRKGGTYTATVLGGPSGAKDLAGNGLAASKVWTFKIKL